jgi:hypothetical protein
MIATLKAIFSHLGRRELVNWCATCRDDHGAASPT